LTILYHRCTNYYTVSRGDNLLPATATISKATNCRQRGRGIIYKSTCEEQ